MSEDGTKPNQIGTTWGEVGPIPYTSEFPPDGVTDVGWQPKDEPVTGPGQIIPANFNNGVLRYLFQAVNWISAGHTRVFETLAEGIAATVAPALFVVRSPATGLRAMGDIAFAVYGGAGASTGPNNYIFYPCTDGLRVYYHEGEPLQSKIYAADPADGSDLWDLPVTVGTGALALTCDGERVYYTDFDDVLAVYSLDPADGAAIGQSDTAGLGIEKLKANGEFIIGIDPTNKRVHVHSDVQEATLVYDGYVQSPEFSVDSIAIDHVNGYFGGDFGLSGTYSVYQFDLSTLAIGWSIRLPTLAGSAGRINVYAMATDGVTLFLSTERIELLAGGFATVYALNSLDGSVIWTADTGFDGHDSAIAIDDYWVYAGNENQNHTVILDKRSGRIVGVIADHVAYGADGVSTIGQGGSLNPNGDKITRNWRGGPSRKLQRVYGVDPNRHPFHTLAVPTTERP